MPCMEIKFWIQVTGFDAASAQRLNIGAYPKVLLDASHVLMLGMAVAYGIKMARMWRREQ